MRSGEPFVGSVANELWSMGTEAAAETSRRLGERVAGARRVLRLR